MFSAAAQTLAAFCEALPDLPREQVAQLLTRIPHMMAAPAQEAVTKLSQLSTLLTIPLTSVIALLTRIPAAWNSSAEGVQAKVSPLASELGVSMDQAVDLLISQPSIWSMNNMVLVKVNPKT